MVEIKAILFDMDGVLIDAKEWHYEALNKALSLFGYQISRYDHLVTYDGLPTKKKLQMLSLERGLPKSLHQFLNALKQQYTMELIYSKCKPIFKHEYALSCLKELEYKLAVCSNSIRNTVEVMLDKSNLKQYFNVILSNQDVIKPKPDPSIYLAAMKKLNVSPESSLIIEDNEHGIQAARNSGAHLMVVSAVADVNLENIQTHINTIEGMHS